MHDDLLERGVITVWGLDGPRVDESVILMWLYDSKVKRTAERKWIKNSL